VSNDFYTPSGAPTTKAFNASAPLRSEFSALQAAFDKMPGLAANPSKLVRVNPGGTALAADVTLVSGTWTPAISCSTTVGDLALIYFAQEGSYMRFGDLVFLSFRISATVTHTTSIGTIQVTGLPFAVGASDMLSPIIVSGLNLLAGTPGIPAAALNAGLSYFSLSNYGVKTSGTALEITDITSGNQMLVSGMLMYSAV